MAIALTLVLLLATPDPSAEFDLGRAAAQKGDFHAAIPHLTAAARGFPDWGLAWLELADALVHDGSDPKLLEEAVTKLERVETQSPRAFALIGQVREAWGDTQKAMDAYSRACTLRPDFAEGCTRLGLLLAQSGKFSEAVPHLKKAVDASPGDRGLRANLAEAFEKSGDLKAAELQLKAAVDLAPTNALFRRRLAQFYERTGDAKRAEEEFRKADEGRPQRKLRPLPPSKH